MRNLPTLLSIVLPLSVALLPAGAPMRSTGGERTQEVQLCAAAGVSIAVSPLPQSARLLEIEISSESTAEAYALVKADADAGAFEGTPTDEELRAEALSTLRDQPLWILAIGPLFAALAGIGFKEFFCFQRPEAIGLTLLLPAALMGHLVGLINGPLCLALLESAALLLVLLALRKFGMEAAADVGDKSVFAYLDGQLPAGKP